MKRKRDDWRDCMPGLDIGRLVFLDESGVNTVMTRLYGRCPQGRRMVEPVPAGHYVSSTLLSGVRLDGVVAPILLGGTVNAETFAGYVEQCLAPELRPGDILVLDNLPAHKGARVTAAVEAAGCTLAYLPPYSPDLNPIENMWSKVKARVRAAAARTVDTVVDAVRDGLASITFADCEGFFEHCGYGDTAT